MVKINEDFNQTRQGVIRRNPMRKNKKMKKTYDNLLPMSIEIGVYYSEDDEGYIIAIDEDSMREEYEEKIKELKALAN